MKEYNVLIVDDKKINRDSASMLTEMGCTVDRAVDLASATRILGRSGFRKPEVEAKKYDAVLTDMMFPLGGNPGEIAGLAHEWERHNENPMGYALALYAAKEGVPLIGVLTDQNHHSGPIAATFDLFYDSSENGLKGKPVFTINSSKVVMYDEDDVRNVYAKKDGSFDENGPWGLPEEEQEQFVKDGGDRFVRAKNWAALLKLLRGDE